jgi:hypothetical protein
VRGDRSARVAAAAGVVLVLGACSALQASPSSSTISHGPSVTATAVTATGARLQSLPGSRKTSTSTTGTAGKSSTTASTSAGSGSTADNKPLAPNETSQIDDELVQLGSLLGDTNADFQAGQKEN